MTQRERCGYHFAPGVRCQMVDGHDQPYYPYLDRGQWGEYSHILSAGTDHQVYAPCDPLPPREEWTGRERRDSVETWPVFRRADFEAAVPADTTGEQHGCGERLAQRFHEFEEDADDASMCLCGVPALTHAAVEPVEPWHQTPVHTVRTLEDEL